MIVWGLGTDAKEGGSCEKFMSIVTLSILSVVIEEPTKLSNDSKVKVYYPGVTPFASIKTSAEEGPFKMVTNVSVEALFCLRLILELHKLVIAEFICSTENFV